MAISLRRNCRHCLRLVRANLSDENFSAEIVRVLIRRRPAINLVRVQDVGLKETDDRPILDWATKERRVSRSLARPAVGVRDGKVTGF